MACERDPAAIVAALGPLAAGVNARVEVGQRMHLHEGGLACYFRPGLPIAQVAAALRWERPVASSGDVHMTSWQVRPYESQRRHEWRGTPFGHWLVRVELEGWPRGAAGAALPAVPELRGASSTFDVSTGCETRVRSIYVLPPEADRSR